MNNSWSVRYRVRAESTQPGDESWSQTQSLVGADCAFNDGLSVKDLIAPSSALGRRWFCGCGFRLPFVLSCADLFCHWQVGEIANPRDKVAIGRTEKFAPLAEAWAISELRFKELQALCSVV